MEGFKEFIQTSLRVHQDRLVFATNNLYKLAEARHILPASIHLLSLRDIQYYEDLPETHETMEENATEKALHVFNHCKVNCFAEDSGLEVEALGGAPGVYSARYAGEKKKDSDNIRLLLDNMKEHSNRNAQFRTVIALVRGGETKLFEGIVRGKILSEAVGENGFGYDPVFQPEGFNISFAQMSTQQKSEISHRKIALDKLRDYLLQRKL